MLGRQSTNLKSGIVGLANIGKSTLFQAITNSKLGNPANYPFATINPLDYKLKLPNAKLTFLKDKYNSTDCTHASLTLYDIAGLTRGASNGQGLGNKFLNDIRNVDSILHVVRGFNDDEIIHLEKTVDSIRDLVLVNDELILKDLEFLEGGIERMNKRSKNNSNSNEDRQFLKRELTFLINLQDHLYNGKKIIHFKKDWSTEEISILNEYNFLTAKPTLILLNINPHEYILSQFDPQKISIINKAREWISENAPGEQIVPFSGHFETQYNFYKNDNNDLEGFHNYCSNIINQYELQKMTEVPLDVNQIKTSVPQIIVKTKKILNLISYYTCGPKEIREWLIKNGTTASEAAGVIHSDLQKTFINAELIAFKDLENGPNGLINESYLKSKGQIKRVGKQHIMQDNDIALFKATASNK